MIRLEGVEKLYAVELVETLALSGIHLEIDAGEFVSVMGPSGSGKSTLLNLIGLLDRPTRGRIAFDGRDVLALPDRELAHLRNQRIGFIFQSFHLIRDLSVLDNIELPLLYRPMSARQRRRACQEALDLVGLGSRGRDRPGQLSGGQQQRAAIARAVVGRPALLLADEPTGNLDSQMGEEIMSILVDLNQRRGTTLVTVTHDQRIARRSGRVVRLFDGRRVV